MHVEWMVVSLALLTPAIAGCQVTLPVRSASSAGWQEVPHAATDEPAETLPPPKATADDKTVLTLYEEPEPLVPPTVRSEQEALTLADLEEIASENNPTLATAAARLDAARGKYLQVGLYPNPVIGYHATEIGNLGTAGQQGGFISQRFITAGKLRLDQAIAGKEVDESHFRLHAQEQRVLNDVRVRFYDALVAQRRLELTKKLARISDDLVRASQKLLDARQVSENDLLQSEIEAESAQILSDNAHNQDVEAWRRLSAVLGVATMEMTPLAGDLDEGFREYSWEDCYEMALGQSPELDEARTRVERARFAVERARREWIPNVDVWVSVRHHNVTESDVANVEVGIPIPIFDANQGNIQSANSELIAAENSLRRIELDLQDRLAVAFRRYSNARQQVDRYSKRVLPRAQKSLDLVTDGYEKGQVRYLTLITTQRTFFQVNLAYLDAVRELHEAMIVIEGQLLTGSLSER